MSPAENDPGNGTDQPRPGGSSPAPRPLSRGDLFRPGGAPGARDTSQGRSEEAPDEDETSQYPADEYQPDEYRPAGYRSVEYRSVDRPRPAEQPTQHLPEAQSGDEPNLFEPRRPDAGSPGGAGGPGGPGGPEQYQPGQYQPGQYQRYQPSPYQPGQYQPWQYEPAEDRGQEPSPGGEYQPGQYQPGQYQRGDYEPGQYQPGQYQPGQYQPGQYQPGQYQPGQYQPGQYQRGDDPYPQEPVIRTASGAPATDLQPQTWYDDGEPPSGGKRTAFVVSLLGVALLLVTAAAAYVLFNGDDGTTTASPDAPAVTTPAATPSPTPTTEPPPTTPPVTATTRPSATAAPAGFPPISDTPWTEKALDFGFLTKVEQVRGTVRITFNRATFYHGDAATKQNGGVPPDNDYLIRDTNPRLRTFVMDPRAPIEGSTRLGGPGTTAEGVSMTMDEFLQNTSGLQGDKGSSVPVWLRHSGGGDGPVVALAEQYIP